MNEKKRKTGVKIAGYGLILLLVGGALLLGLEAWFRFQGDYPRSHFQYDPQLIWRLRPNYRGMKTWGDDHFPLHFNRQGFRGADWTMEKPGGVGTRLMVLGDSYTAGLDVRQEDLYTTVLERLLNEGQSSGSRFEVLNAGCPAWGTGQEYIFWRTEGRQYRPDMLLLMVAPNDLREMYMKKLVTRSSPRPQIHPVRYPAKARRGWWWANHSSFFQYLQKKHLDTHYGNFYDIFVHYPVNFGKGDEGNWDLPVFLREPFPEVAEARVLFKEVVADLQAECRQSGTKLLLSVIPTRMEFDGTLDTTLYQPGAVAALLQEISAQQDIPFLDLYADVGRSADPSALFLSWDFHMNETGNRYLAERLVDFVRVHAVR